MKEPSVDDVVRLTNDVPYLNLHKGQEGVVRSLWHASQIAYEVEFTGLDECTRAVLMREQVALNDDKTIEENSADARWELNPGAW